MSLLGTIIGGITRVGKTVFGGGRKLPGLIGTTAVGAVGGAAIGGLTGGAPKRRRRRKRITDSELAQLMMLKAVVGTRSPLLTIAGLKMLNRGS